MIAVAGMPYAKWEAKHGGGPRWATDEECRAEFGLSRERWLELWRACYEGDWWKVLDAMRRRDQAVSARWHQESFCERRPRGDAEVNVRGKAEGLPISHPARTLWDESGV